MNGEDNDAFKSKKKCLSITKQYNLLTPLHCSKERRQFKIILFFYLVTLAIDNLLIFFLLYFFVANLKHIIYLKLAKRDTHTPDT